MRRAPYYRYEIGLEVKSSKKWRPEFEFGLVTLLEANKIKKGFAVYLGSDRLKSNGIDVFPIKDFLNYLHCGELF